VKVVEDGREKVVDTTIEDVAKEANIYDPRRRYEPLPVIIGRSSLLEGVEEALRSMDVKEKRVVEVPPEKGYGVYREDLVVRLPLRRFIEFYGRRPSEGEEVDVPTEKGVLRGRVVRVTQRFVYIDLNHPLAGKTLKVEIEVVDKLEKDEDKIRVLMSRYLGVPLKDIEVRAEGEGVFRAKLPQTILGFSDLDARLANAIKYVAEMVAPRKLVLEVEVELAATSGGEAGGREAGEEKGSDEGS
jgi:peptidylprolyl isomerase